jgi:hypothetical protein
MRYLSILYVLLFPAVVSAGDPLTPRPLDPLAAETFERALAGSRLVRSLVATLESSNVIVHIQASRQLPASIGGMTRFVTARGGYRYLRITIAVDLPPSAQTAILGHELQHACEVAESGADDVASLQKLFARVGRRNGEYFETQSALRVEKMIRMELRATPAAVTHPGK